MTIPSEDVVTNLPLAGYGTPVAYGTATQEWERVDILIDPGNDPKTVHSEWFLYETLTDPLTSVTLTVLVKKAILNFASPQRLMAGLTPRGVVSLVGKGISTGNVKTTIVGYGEQSP